MHPDFNLSVSGELSTEGFTSARDFYINEDIPPSDKRSKTTEFHQGHRFINDINIGDIVLTIGKDHISIGRVSSQTQINRLLTQPSINNIQRGPQHRLYKEVQWFAHKSRRRGNNIPSVISRLIQSPPLTVYSANEYRESIFSWAFPFYSMNDTLNVSTNILSTAQINSGTKSRYQLLLCQIEIFAKQLGQNITEDNIQTALSQLEQIDLENLWTATATEKAEYMSPGFSWSCIHGMGAIERAIFLAIVLSLFGNQANAEEQERQVTALLNQQNTPHTSIVDMLNEAKEKIARNFKAVEIRNELSLEIPRQPRIAPPIANPENSVR